MSLSREKTRPLPPDPRPRRLDLDDPTDVDMALPLPPARCAGLLDALRMLEADPLACTWNMIEAMRADPALAHLDAHLRRVLVQILLAPEARSFPADAILARFQWALRDLARLRAARRALRYVDELRAHGRLPAELSVTIALGEEGPTLVAEGPEDGTRAVAALLRESHPEVRVRGD